MPLHVIYFESASGEIQLPPTSDTPCPRRFLVREANTIAELEALEKRLQQEVRDRTEREAEREETMWLERRRETRRRLMAAVERSDATPYDKDFILGWCQLRDEKRREDYKKIFQQREAYFVALHYDNPNEHIARSIGE